MYWAERTACQLCTAEYKRQDDRLTDNSPGTTARETSTSLLQLDRHTVACVHSKYIWVYQLDNNFIVSGWLSFFVNCEKISWVDTWQNIILRQSETRYRIQTDVANKGLHSSENNICGNSRSSDDNMCGKWSITLFSFSQIEYQLQQPITIIIDTFICGQLEILGLSFSTS